MKKAMTLILVILVLFTSISFASCNNNKTDSNNSSTTGTSLPQKALTEEESMFVGKWRVSNGYNATEGIVKEDGELSIDFYLNEDLTGKLIDNNYVVGFTWSYAGTNDAEYNPSVHYMNFQCVIAPDAIIPDGNTVDEFYFDVDTESTETLFLTFGNWLYNCKRV